MTIGCPKPTNSQPRVWTVLAQPVAKFPLWKARGRAAVGKVQAMIVIVFMHGLMIVVDHTGSIGPPEGS